MPRVPTLLFVFLLGSAQALAMDTRLATAWEPGPARASHIQTLVADGSLTDEALAEAMASPDWQIRQQASVVFGWRSWPELYARFAVEQAAPTRAGVLRFRGSELADVRLTPLLLERLVEQPEPAYELALIEALPRTGGDWGEAFVSLIQSEEDPSLRAVLVASMRWAPDAPAFAGIRAGLGDPDGDVRGEAARAVGWHEHGAALADELVGTLSDDHPYARAMAARSLG